MEIHKNCHSYARWLSMSVDLKQHLPNYYSGVHETDVLMKVEEALFDQLATNMKVTIDNQFILSADVTTISVWERLLGIQHDPALDTLGFRRERVINRLTNSNNFTLWFLRERLDVLLSRENYEIMLNHNNYTLHVETAVNNQTRFNEMVLMVRQILPANMIFRLVPVLRDQLQIKASAQISGFEPKRLGSWSLGISRFRNFGEWQEVVLHD